MQRFLIQSSNFALLALLLIGVPAVAHAQMGDWQISPVSTLHRLIFFGLLIGGVGNGVAAGCLIKSRKERNLCWEWAVVFGGLLAMQFAFAHGYLNFEWLKQTLRWLQKHF
jgi:hypothetical protein